MKTNSTLLAFAIFAALIVGIFIGKEAWQTAISPVKQQLQYEAIMLQQVKDMLVDAYVPDSIKDETHDASYNLMYAEPDGNDYWASRGTIHQTEEYIKTCEPCMYIDSLLKAKEEQLKEFE